MRPMFGGRPGIAEYAVIAGIFLMFTLVVGSIVSIFRPFRWKRAFIGMGALWLLAVIGSLFGC